MSHTPGPWKWEETSDGWDGTTTHFVAPSVIEQSTDGAHSWPKSVLSGWGHDAWGINVDEADAHLIAAAPELLEAAESLERVVVEFYPGHAEPEPEHKEEFRAVWAAVTSAREAIAKAKGVPA